jgi:transposase
VAFLTKRKKGDKTYYYLARAFRKDGTPTHEILACLGTIEDIQTNYTENKESVICEKTPCLCRIYQFGSVAALLDIAERLELSDIIDEQVTKRNQGLSVGSYMVLAAINRAVQPVSKNSFYEWFCDTVLASSFPEANNQTLSSQSFWNHMIELDQDAITNIENKLTKRIVEYYGINTDCLLFDNTNFITYIDTNNKATIPQRGHSKEKRSDLKIIGLSLMATSDYNIPLFHEVYPGNKHDSKQIIDIIYKLKQRLSLVSNNYNNTTLVFDKGNNSEDFINILENDPQGKIHFVGGLRLNQCPELVTIERERYVPLNGDNFGETSAFRFQKEIYGHNFTVIITDNPKLRKEQLDGLNANILKCENELKTLQNSLTQRANGVIKRGRKRTIASVNKNVLDILSAEHMKKVFFYEISSIDNQIALNFKLDIDKYNHLLHKYLGKSILFTNRDNMNNEEIVSIYRSQFHIEDNFKQLKNIKYLSFRPVRHFTDRTIRVHAFYCVIALTLCSLLRLELEKLGHKMSINAVLKELSQARQSLHFYLVPGNKKTTFVSAISEVSQAAEKYIEEYGLKKYLLK